MCTRSASKVIIQCVPTLFCALVSKARANDVIRKLNEGLRNHSICIAFSCTSLFKFLIFVRLLHRTCCLYWGCFSLLWCGHVTFVVQSLMVWVSSLTLYCNDICAFYDLLWFFVTFGWQNTGIRKMKLVSEELVCLFLFFVFAIDRSAKCFKKTQ